MPELPEVEVVVRGLKKNILNLKVLEFKVINKRLRFLVQQSLIQSFHEKFRIMPKHIFLLSR